MRNWSVPPLLALFGALMGFATLRAADDPGNLFLQAYQAYKGAERLEADGRSVEAAQKYRYCASLLEQVRKNSPSYEPIVIDFRLKKSREGIARVQSLPADPSANENLPTPARAVPAPLPQDLPRPQVSASAPRFAGFSTAYRLPVAVSEPPVVGRANAADPVDQVVERGILNALKDEIRGLQLRLNQEKRTTADLNLKLLESTAREQMALTEVDRTKVQNVELKGQLEEASRSLGDIQQSTARMAAEKAAADQRVASLEADLDAAHADLEVANEYNGELFTKLERAAQFIDSSEKIRSQLLADRKLLSGREGSRSAEFEKLQRARDAALAKNDVLRKEASEAEDLAKKNQELTAKFASAERQILDIAKNRDAQEKSADSLQQEIARLKRERESTLVSSEAWRRRADAADDLAQQNKQLTAKLAAAEEKQLGSATQSRQERQKMEGSLRAEIDGVNRTLASMREQLSAGAERIVELEKQLSDTASATAATTGAIAQENALLKDLVTRQLSEQARRQQARKLVEEEMEKLQIRSTALVEKLNSLADSEVDLSPQEKKLFEQPPTAIASGGDFSLVIAKKEPASDLPPDLSVRAKEANALAQQGRLLESREIYEELALKAPSSYFAAVNLGITERRLGNYPQAIDAFKHALELKAGDPFTLTNLGGAQFRGGEIAASVNTLKQAAEADEESYLARYLLALALNQSGDSEGARREVDSALDINPDYLPAVQLSGELPRPPATTRPKTP